MVLSVVLLQCQKSPTGPQSVKNFYPLDIGNFWLYSSAWGEVRVEIIGYDHLSERSLVFVKRKITSSGSTLQNYFPLRGSADTTFSYLQFIGDELREYTNKKCNLDYKIILKSPLQVGTEWHVLAESSCVYGKLGRPLYVDNGWVVAIENIATPAGIFNDCFEIVSVPLASDTRDIYWFASYVGIVKLENVRFAGSRTYTLKEYRVR